MPPELRAQYQELCLDLWPRRSPDRAELLQELADTLDWLDAASKAKRVPGIVDLIRLCRFRLEMESGTRTALPEGIPATAIPTDKPSLAAMHGMTQAAVQAALGAKQACFSKQGAYLAHADCPTAAVWYYSFSPGGPGGMGMKLLFDEEGRCHQAEWTLEQ